MMMARRIKGACMVIVGRIKGACIIDRKIMRVEMPVGLRVRV